MASLSPADLPRHLYWEFDSAEWQDSTTIQDFRDEFSDMPQFCEMVRGEPDNKCMRDLPWTRIVSCTFASDRELLLSPEDFGSYLRKWCEESPRVKDMLTWKRCTRLDLCNQSRLGAWVGDCLYTEWLVRLGKVRPNVEFLAVGNGPYKEFARDIGMLDLTGNSSPNNCGNQFEFLYWLAIEEGRQEWALSVAHIMATSAMFPPCKVATVAREEIWTRFPGDAAKSRIVALRAETDTHVDRIHLVRADGTIDTIVSVGDYEAGVNKTHEVVLCDSEYIVSVKQIYVNGYRLGRKLVFITNTGTEMFFEGAQGLGKRSRPALISLDAGDGKMVTHIDIQDGILQGLEVMDAPVPISGSFTISFSLKHRSKQINSFNLECPFLVKCRSIE